MVQSFKFLFISKKTEECDGIISELERNRLYTIEHVETAPATLVRMKQGGIHCLVFNFDQISLTQVKLITDLRDLSYNFPVIVFANNIDLESLDIVKNMEAVVIIEKPYESKDVWGICQKLLQGRKVNQRIFRRYYTMQPAHLERSSGERLTGKIYNLSKGGAFMELTNSGRVKPGDFFRLTINLDKLSRSYNVDAQVVWATPNGFTDTKPSLGLKFIRSQDVYRDLLNKL